MKEWKTKKFGRFEYKISNHGDVVRLPSYISNGKSISLRKEKKLTGTITRKGYIGVELDYKWYPIHRLVAMMFIDNPLNKEQVNHLDGNKLNNHVSNLEWCTNLENMRHAYKTGLQINDFGEKARNFKYKYICNERPELGELMALDFAKIFYEEGKIMNIKSCASNIRYRLSANGSTFKKVSRKVGE